MIKLKDMIYYDGSNVLVKKDNKVEHINKEQLNEYIDLGTPVKGARDALTKFSNHLDNYRGGSFDADAGEYIGFEEKNEIIEALQNEIAQLRTELLDTQRQLIESQTQTPISQEEEFLNTTNTTGGGIVNGGGY